MADHHNEAAQRIHEKFYFYLVGLAFTILGLSIQTSKLGQFVLSDVFEISGWICLLTSGIIGLLRLEMEPFLHEKYSALNSLEVNKIRLVELEQSGEKIVRLAGDVTPESIEDIKNRTDEVYAAIEKKTIEDKEKLIRKYTVQKYGFIIGIVSLVIARGIFPYKIFILSILR